MYYIHIVGNGEPTKGHETYDEARAEAERLAQKGSMNNKIIRTVGEAHDRFNEDGLRILRAIRIATETGFKIDKNTEKAIVNSSSLLKNIAINTVILASF